MGITTPHCKNISLSQNVTQSLGLGWILWYVVSNRKLAYDLVHGV
jgi:hypothetical protein